MAATEPTLSELREKIERADQMVDALCQPRYTPNAREWTMSIPARPDHDPDLVIGAGLDAGRAALERLEALERERAAARSSARSSLITVLGGHHPFVSDAEFEAYIDRILAAAPAPAPQSSTPFELPELLPISGDELSQAILRSRARAPAPQGKPEYETALDTLLGPQPENFAELLARRSILQHQLTLVEQALDRIAPAPAPQQGGTE